MGSVEIVGRQVLWALFRRGFDPYLSLKGPDDVTGRHSRILKNVDGIDVDPFRLGKTS